MEVYGVAKKYELRGLEQLAKTEMLDLGGRLDAFTVIGVLEQQPTDSDDKWLDEFVKGWARKAFQDPGRVLRAQEEDETQGHQETTQGMVLAKKFMRGLLEVYEEMNSNKKPHQDVDQTADEPVADDFATGMTTQVESIGLEEPLPQPAEVEITKETFSITTETKHVDFHDNSAAPVEAAAPVQQHEHTIYRPFTPPPRSGSPRQEFGGQDEVKELEADQWVPPATSPSLEAALGLQPAEFNELPTEGAVELSPKFSPDFSIERDPHHEPDRQSILEPEPEAEEPVMLPLDAVVDDDVPVEKAEGEQGIKEDTPVAHELKEVEHHEQPHVEHIEHREPEVAQEQELEHKEVEPQVEEKEPEVTEPEVKQPEVDVPEVKEPEARLETKEEEAFSTPNETIGTPMEGLVYTSTQKELDRPVTPQPRESMQTPPEGIRTPQNGLIESHAEDSPASVTASPSSPSKSRKKNLKRKAKLAEAKKRASSTLSPVMSVASTDATPSEIPARDIASPEPLSLEATKDKPTKGIWHWTPSYDEGKDGNKSLTFSNSEGNMGTSGSTGVLAAPVEIFSGGVHLPEVAKKNTAFEDELTRESHQSQEGPHDSETPRTQIPAAAAAKKAKVTGSVQERPQTPLQSVSEGQTPGEQTPMDELTSSPKSPKKKRKTKKKVVKPTEESTALVGSETATPSAETPAETPQETPQETPSQEVLSRPGPAKPTKKMSRDRKDSKLSPEPTAVLPPPTSSPSSPDIRSSLQSPPQSPPQPAYKIFWPWGSSKQANQPKDEPLSLDQALAPAPKSEQKPEPETSPEPLALEGQSDAPTEPASTPKKKKTTKKKKSTSKVSSGGGAPVVEPEPETQPQPRESEAAPESAAAQARPEVTQQDVPKDDKDSTNTEDVAQVAQPAREEVQHEAQPVVEQHAVHPTTEEQQPEMKDAPTEAQPEAAVVDPSLTPIILDVEPPIELQTHIISPTGAVIDTLPTIPEDITPSASITNLANPSLTGSVTDTLSNSVAVTAVEYQNSSATLPLPVDVGAVGGLHELAADHPVEVDPTTVGETPGAESEVFSTPAQEVPGEIIVLSGEVELVGEEPDTPGGGAPLVDANDLVSKPAEPVSESTGATESQSKPSKIPLPDTKADDKPAEQQTPTEGSSGWGSWLGVRKNKKKAADKDKTADKDKGKKDDSKKTLSTKASKASIKGILSSTSGPSSEQVPQANNVQPNLEAAQSKTQLPSTESHSSVAAADEPDQQTQRALNSVKSDPELRPSTSSSTNTNDAAIQALSQSQTTGKSSGWGFPLGKKRRNTSASHGSAPPVVATATSAAAAVPRAIPEAVKSTVSGTEVSGSHGSGSGSGSWGPSSWFFPGTGGKDGKDAKETHGNGASAGKGDDGSGDGIGKVNGDGGQVDVKGAGEEEQDKSAVSDQVDVRTKDTSKDEKDDGKNNTTTESVKEAITNEASAIASAADEALNKALSKVSSIANPVKDNVDNTINDSSDKPVESTESTEPASTEAATEQQPPAIPPKRRTGTTQSRTPSTASVNRDKQSVTTTSNKIPGDTDQPQQQFFLDREAEQPGSNTQVQTPSAPIESLGNGSSGFGSGSNPQHHQLQNNTEINATATPAPAPAVAALAASSDTTNGIGAKGSKGTNDGTRTNGKDVSVATVTEVQGQVEESTAKAGAAGAAGTTSAGAGSGSGTGKGLWSGGSKGGDGKGADGGKDGGKTTDPKPKTKTRSDSWSLWGMSGRSKRNSVSSG